MTNQRTLDMLHHSIYGDPDFEQYDISEDELSHHGVLGMSWGKRHGPPYPLGGVDKRVARAEAKRKREKERRLKKLQKAAKKARKLKKREEKEAADIQKKKQKLVKKGDMDAIKKNAKLFTNEELQYIVERDEAKRSILGTKERDEQEALQKFGEKLGQIAGIAAQAGQIMGAIKQGSDMVKSFQDVEFNKRKIENERRGAIQKEFEMRFGKEDHSPEAQRFISKALRGEEYEAPKASKVEKNLKKAQDDQLQREIDDYWMDVRAKDAKTKEKAKQSKADAKAQNKAEKNAEKIRKDLNSIKYVEDATDLWSTTDKNSEWNISKKRQSFDYPDWYASSFDPGRSSEANGKSFASSFLGSGSGSASTFSRESVSLGKNFLNSKYKLAGRSSYSGGSKKSFEDAPSSNAVNRLHSEAWGGEGWKRPEINPKNKYMVSDRSAYRSLEAYKNDQNKRRAEESRKAFEAAEKRAADMTARFAKEREERDRRKRIEKEARDQERAQLYEAANAAKQMTAQRAYSKAMELARDDNVPLTKDRIERLWREAQREGNDEYTKVLKRGYPGEWGAYGYKRK